MQKNKINNRLVCYSALIAILGIFLYGCSATPVPAGPHSLSGTVSGVSPVTVNLSGTSSGATTTSSSGYYSFTGLDDGYYIVRPSKTGYSFTPYSRTVTVASADATGINFDLNGPPETSEAE
ncbi:MAG: carboxypeptidase regulatory-like domain-containing protein [Candidatus Saganbacteria bacterium]|nr:carboxypeptidase regulatory-like domain-containing protein [Candidatus Saganbacteria bacterium]